MGLFDFVGDIFSSDVFSPSGGGVSTASSLLKPQERLLRGLSGGLEGLRRSALTPIGPQQIAPTSPLQQLAFGGFGGLAGLGQQGFNLAQQGLSGIDPQQAQGFLGTAGQALQQGLGGFDPGRISEAFAPSRQLALNLFNQDIVPNLLERFGATSGASGPLNKQLAESGANLALGLRGQEAPFIGTGTTISGCRFSGQPCPVTRRIRKSVLRSWRSRVRSS